MPSAEMAHFIELMSQNRVSADQFSIDAARAGWDAATISLPRAPDVSERPAVLGGVRVVWSESHTPTEAVVVYFHGGAYCVGSAQNVASSNSFLAAESLARVVSVDYRLAPEHPYPAAIDDGLAVYRELVRSGTSPERIVLAGDSAGGALALAVAFAAREAGEALPAGYWLVSPWLDLTLSGSSFDDPGQADPFMTRESLAQFVPHYLAGMSPELPLASPVRGDFSRFGPILVQVGAQERLLSDSLLLQERARAAGVDVTLELHPDGVHTWTTFASELPEGREAVTRAARFVERVTTPRMQSTAGKGVRRPTVRSLPPSTAGYSPAVMVDNLIFLSGQIGIDHGTKEISAGFEAQFRRAAANVAAVLGDCGSDLSHVVRLTVYLADASYFAASGALFSELFGRAAPVRTTLVVAGLPGGALLELEAVAVPSP